MKKYSIVKLNLFYLIAIAILLSCTDEKNKKQETITSNNRTKPSSSFSDTLKITEEAAVFYFPDSIQLEKIKAITDSNVYNSSLHEYFYQMRNARIIFKKFMPEIKILEARNVRYLLFMYKDNKTECIDLDTKNDAYGLILFNPEKPPMISDMANIEGEVGLYFSK